MNQAFRSSHKVGLEDYQNSPEVRLQVEMQRQRDYELAQQVAAQYERQIHH